MKNVKDQIYSSLSREFVNVSDSYPKDWTALPAIQITEEQNKVYERTNDTEQKAIVRYRIDIWDRVSTSESALLADNAISLLGLVRTDCKDVPDPSGMKHKEMRYEGIICMDSELVFWNI